MFVRVEADLLITVGGRKFCGPLTQLLIVENTYEAEALKAERIGVGRL